MPLLLDDLGRSPRTYGLIGAAAVAGGRDRLRVRKPLILAGTLVGLVALALCPPSPALIELIGARGTRARATV